MLKAIITEHILFYLAGGALIFAMIAQLVVAVSLKRISNAAEDMGKSNYALMKYMRSKFEHACMVNDKVQDVKSFVEKYVHEHRVGGLRLYTWRRLKMLSIWAYAILCIFGAAGAYAFELVSLEIAKYLVMGATGILFMSVLHLLADEKYRIKAAQIYMIDFLGNTYAPRYDKEKKKAQRESVPQTHPAEEPAMAVSAPVTQGVEAAVPVSAPHPVETFAKEQPEQERDYNLRDGFDAKKEARIREILEEFLV